jgi:hypothetical protein
MNSIPTMAQSGSMGSHNYDAGTTRQRRLPSIHFHRKKKSMAEEVQELREEVENSKQSELPTPEPEQELQQSPVPDEENAADPSLRIPRSQKNNIQQNSLVTVV